MRTLNNAFYSQAQKLLFLYRRHAAEVYRIDASDPLVMLYSNPKQSIVMIGPVPKQYLKLPT